MSDTGGQASQGSKPLTPGDLLLETLHLRHVAEEDNVADKGIVLFVECSTDRLQQDRATLRAGEVDLLFDDPPLVGKQTEDLPDAVGRNSSARLPRTSSTLRPSIASAAWLNTMSRPVGSTAIRPIGMFSTRLSEKALIRESELRAVLYPWARKSEMIPEQLMRRKMRAIHIVWRLSSSWAATIGPISRPTKITKPGVPSFTSGGGGAVVVSGKSGSSSPVGANRRYISKVSAPSLWGTCLQASASEPAIVSKSSSIRSSNRSARDHCRPRSAPGRR